MCVTFSLDCANGYCENVRDMSETFTKLFGSITDSTIWLEDSDTRIVWVTMLAMSDRFGYVGASLPGLAARAHVPLEKAEAALAKFMAPDPYSRSKDFEGRRIEEADRGWNILNYERFRDMRDEEARKEYERVRKRDQRRKMSGTNRDKPGQSRDVPESPAMSAHAEADTEADTETEIRNAPRFTPASVLAIWGKTKASATNQPEWGGSAGISPDKARTAADMLSASSCSVAEVAASMEAFWADVKSKRNKDHEKIKKNNPFAFGCWYSTAASYIADKQPAQVDQREEERRSRPLARIPGT